LKSTDWKDDHGYTALLTIQMRTADITYARRTAAFVMHSFKPGTSPVSFTWSTLQEAHHAILTGDGVEEEIGDLLDITSSDDASSLADIIEELLPVYGDELADSSSKVTDTSGSLQYNKVSVRIPAILEVIKFTYSGTTRQSFAGSSVLHNILAIPIYWCSSASRESFNFSQLGTGAPYKNFTGATGLSLAESQYTIRVGLWSIVVYAVVGSVMISFSFATLVIATFHPVASQLPNVGLYPLFDCWKWLTVSLGNGSIPRDASRETDPPIDWQVQLKQPTMI
jgi:hypothetical protein